MVQRALTALRANHHEAAIALAVAVDEPLALWTSEPRGPPPSVKRVALGRHPIGFRRTGICARREKALAG